MPTHYAHYRFGVQALPTLPPQAQRSIQRFRGLYDVGLHGPDIFFYHNPFFHTRVGTLGRQLHRMTGQEFFTLAALRCGNEGARVYLYGLLGHYCLDSACHPYILKQVSQGSADHVALEAEFDRYLMAMDGIESPHTHDVTGHMKLTRGECATAASLYADVKPGDIRQCLTLMGSLTRFLAGENRGAVEKLTKTFSAKHMNFILPEEPVGEYARMDSELLARFNRAAKSYPAMVAALQAHMEAGTPLPDAFDPTFG